MKKARQGTGWPSYVEHTSGCYFFTPICNKAVAEQKQTYQFTHNTNTGVELT